MAASDHPYPNPISKLGGKLVMRIPRFDQPRGFVRRPSCKEGMAAMDADHQFILNLLGFQPGRVSKFDREPRG